jgi:hypothetical protein
MGRDGHFSCACAGAVASHAARVDATQHIAAMGLPNVMLSPRCRCLAPAGPPATLFAACP